MAARKDTTQLLFSFTEPEIWRDVPGYEGLYQVSDRGRVRSLDRTITAKRRSGPYQKRFPGKVLRTNKGIAQYPGLTICKDGQRVDIFVHELVLEAFVGPRPPGMVCNHRDSNRHNNVVSNLEWCTQFDNRHHSMDKGLWHPFLLRGEASPSAKLTEEQVRNIRIRVTQGTSMYALAREFDVRDSTIYKIVHRQRWKHVP